MGSLWQILSQLIVQLPVIGVLVAGFALIPSRRGRIGARRANLAMAGLLALVLEIVISIAWSGLGTLLIMNRTIETSHFGVLASVIGFFLAVLTATAVALLLAAAVGSAPLHSGAPGVRGTARGL